ncbi:MAG: PspC domain-containing protein [Bacteroidales bacterium]|jgi:phage shock protein PspC (stress-responsive transcriptional regulator)|nr:PspC domain-containing protein [Bacteroidales bacterium]
MKNVFNICINGIIFGIEEDAFKPLSDYLEPLKAYFSREKDGSEIVADIEARIAELFTERPGGAATAITIADVNAIISTLGTPAAIAGVDESANTEAQPCAPRRTARRLFRNPAERYISGVCGGIATWFGMSPAILRIALIVATFFIHWLPILYLVLWAVIPLAKTTAQKLEMYGKEVNITNIEQSVKDNSLDTGSPVQTFFRDVDSALGRFCRILLRIVVLVIGLKLIVAGLMLLVAFIVWTCLQDVLFRDVVKWDFLAYEEMLRHIISASSYQIFMICSVVFILLTVAACLFWGAQLIRPFKTGNRMTHILLAALWAGSAMGIVGISLREMRHFTNPNSMSETFTVPVTDTLHLQTVSANMKLSNNAVTGLYFDKSQQRFFGEPTLNICHSRNGQALLEIRRRALGRSKPDAFDKLAGIGYQVAINDTLLQLPDLFSVSPPDRWSFQEVHLFLYLPENTIVAMDEGVMAHMHSNAHSRTGQQEYLWRVTDKGPRKIK